MNINICKFTELKDIVEYTQSLRDNGTNDIVIVFKKDTGRDGIAVSKTFLDTNLNLEFIESNNIDVQRSLVGYGDYGNVLSLPEITFMIAIPMNTTENFAFAYVECTFERLFDCEKPTSGINDFMKDGKKVLGRGIYNNGTMYHAIGSLSDIPEYIDNIFSDSWKQSGKVLPSERVLGYREATGNQEATIEDFAEALKFRMNEQLKNTIQDIIVIDMDE